SAGQTSTPLVVQVCGDTDSTESNETFNVTLSSPVNASISDDTGIGTIQNYALPSLSINDVTATEPSSSSTMSQATFTVSMSKTSSVDVSVNYATSNGTATGGGTGTTPTCTTGLDYLTSSGALTISAGQTSTPLVVQVCGDTD